MDSMDINARLRAVATQKMTWQEYQQGGAIHPRVVEKMFKDILNAADIICTTPAVSCQQPFKGWKEEKARGIAVDEAGAMSRPDALSVWGNTLTPTAFSGDDDQLPAPVMTDDIKDDEGNYLNRLALKGKISPLGFLKATGWPVYRLRVQLRMGNGLFNIYHQKVYSDLPFHYSLKSSIANHKIGQTLEDYLRKRFQELKPTHADILQEVFIHCPGTVCLIDPVTKSKRNQEQVNHALKLLSDLVKKTDIPASSIGVISPYKANVELFERCRKDSQYSAPLLNMPAAATVNSFQGREANIMVVILGTTKEVSPGFTVNKNRLNVMLSR
jgi:superfamily I DNA and/or RNA helicase